MTRLLYSAIGNNFKVSSLKDAKYRTDGGIGLPYKWSPKFVYKQDYLDHFLNKLWSFTKYKGGDTMWDCFPKVEILPYEKALRKARIINGSPPETFFIGACLYSDFNEALNDHSLEAKSALGFVAPYGGWSKLFHSLPDICENSDATKFDASISPKLLRMVYHVRENLSSFSEKDRALHWWYFNEIVFRRSYLSNGSVYNVYGGNGSGQYNTSSDNTIAHLLAIAYACSRIGLKYVQFEALPIFVYGDDYIGGAMPTEFWRAFGELGFMFNKSPPQDKFSCDFLSNKFVYTPWGVTGIPVHDKGLYSSYTSEKKYWREVRANKLYSLWLVYYFHPDRYIYERMLIEAGVPFRRLDAINYWFGWMEVLKP